MTDSAQRAERLARRTRNDVAALCVELLRAVREQEFRTLHRSGPAPSVDRAWRAWRTDLDRHGSLHLMSNGQELREGETGPPIGHGRLDDLARRLGERGLSSVIFEPGLDAPTYAAFVSLLMADPETVEKHGGPAGCLPERGVGIRLVGVDTGLDSDDEKPEIETEAAELPAVPPAAGAVTVAIDALEPTSMPETRQPTAPNGSAEPETASDGSRASAFDALEACADETPYGTRVARAVAEAVEQSDAREPDACHRTVLRLAEHAGKKGGRSPADRSSALGGLQELAVGRVLLDLLERATGRDGAASLRASQALMMISEQVAPTLISAIDAQTDPGRREELLGIAIALGRVATPALHRAMEGNSPNRARIAARIAGEIRDDRAVSTLSKLLDHRSTEVRGESARALARIGNVAALTSLKGGLASPHEDVSSLCAYCLGVTGSSEAAEALTETLRQARRDRRTALASAVIRSLGRLGREESVPELKRVIDKRAFFRRHELRELKLQAIGALAQLPGDRARAVLEAIASGSDMGLAVAARRSLKEMAEKSA